MAMRPDARNLQPRPRARRGRAERATAQHLPEGLNLLARPLTEIRERAIFHLALPNSRLSLLIHLLTGYGRRELRAREPRAQQKLLPAAAPERRAAAPSPRDCSA